MTTKELLVEFYRVVDQVYGVYLDANLGFFNNKEEMQRSQNKSIIDFNLTQEKIDNVGMAYGHNPHDYPNSVQHTTTQGEFKTRNEKNGRNSNILGQLCVTQIYNYWEDYYRGKVAQSLGFEKNDLKADIFGDLRLFRHSIIHHRAIALKEIEKCKLITFFDEGEYMNLTEDQVELIVNLVKDEIEILLIRYCPKE